MLVSCNGMNSVLRADIACSNMAAAGVFDESRKALYWFDVVDRASPSLMN